MKSYYGRSILPTSAAGPRDWSLCRLIGHPALDAVRGRVVFEPFLGGRVQLGLPDAEVPVALLRRVPAVFRRRTQSVENLPRRDEIFACSRQRLEIDEPVAPGNRLEDQFALRGVDRLGLALRPPVFLIAV